MGFFRWVFLGFLGGFFNAPGSKRKVEWQVKVLIKNLAIFFLCPSKLFLPISFEIQLLKYFPQKQKEQRHKQPG
jgi:hypothetical protein